ncbi:MAG: flavodoxin [Clostridia bacterium]|nr:flavodoxin [Lachnospiraceae bacterium]NCC01141.1 flavodoxin [Clostridia bacterium]NCD03040.1 flavodoxin [Clostridia bacterium]
MKKRKILCVLAMTTLLLTACGNAESQETSTQAESVTMEDTSEEVETDTTETVGENTGSNILVAYFSYGENADLPEGVDASSSASIQTWNNEITGNTGVIAHMIGDASGADMFSIQTVAKYPSDYNGTINQGEEEKDENVRPELASHIENIEQYDTIFLGFPTWWYDMPMAMYSFLDEYDLSGKTIIMFCTSGGSGFLDAVEQTQAAEPEATVIEGLSIGASSATGAEEQVTAWLQEIGY